jgi:hypothetical protein
MSTTDLAWLDALVKTQQAFGALEDAFQSQPPVTETNPRKNP